MTYEHRSELLAKIGFLAVLTLLIVFAGTNNVSNSQLQAARVVETR